MTRKKSGFFTFCFSLLPGAGEMYMGFYKQGTTLMLTFFLLLGLSSGFRYGSLVFLIPVVWFYSFFHVHNLRGLSDEEFYAVEDSIPFVSDDQFMKKYKDSDKVRKYAAIGLILLGICSLWSVFTDFISWFDLPEVLWNGINRVPAAVIALLIIYIGVRLIKGKKEELDQMPEMSAEETGTMNQAEVVEALAQVPEASEETTEAKETEVNEDEKNS